MTFPTNTNVDDLMLSSYDDGDPNNLMGVPYHIQPALFTRTECNDINQYFDGLQSVKGEVGVLQPDGSIIDTPIHNLRKCDVGYVGMNTENEWFHDRLSNHMLQLNHDIWKVNIVDFSQPIRRMVYNESDHFQAWHVDYGIGQTGFRKLTSVVMLDDPSNYTGGEFQIACLGTIPLNVGDCITFLSYIYHRVLPVTSGLRRSLVYRAIGPRFK